MAIDEPKILGIPFTPGFPEQWIVDLWAEQIRQGTFDAVLLTTAMSGKVATREGGVNLIGFIDDCRREEVPVFLMPDAPGVQVYPRRYDYLESRVGVVDLPNACSAIGDVVVHELYTALRCFDSVEEVIEYMREYFSE